MKRVLAKEFLLLVGCMVLLLLTSLFGWARNSWLTSKADDLGHRISVQESLCDSLELHTKPSRHNFITLFDSNYVSRHCDVFASPLPWRGDLAKHFTIEEFASKYSRVYLSRLAHVLSKEQYFTEPVIAKLSQVPPPVEFAEPPMNWPGLPSSEWMRKLYAGGYVPLPPGSWDPPEDDLLIVEAPDGSELPFPMWMLEEDMEDFMAMFYPGEHLPQTLLFALVASKQKSAEAVIPDMLTAELSPEGQSTDIAFMKAIMRDDSTHATLRPAFAWLDGRGVVRCTFEELLYTLQRELTPPGQGEVQRLGQERFSLGTMEQELKALKGQVWNEEKQWSVVKWVAIVLLLVVYPLRLLTIGTRWAFRTLRA